MRGGFGSQPTLTWDDLRAIQSEAPFPMDCVTTDPMFSGLAETMNLAMEELARRATETVLSVRVSGFKRKG